MTHFSQMLRYLSHLIHAVLIGYVHVIEQEKTWQMLQLITVCMCVKMFLRPLLAPPIQAVFGSWRSILGRDTHCETTFSLRSHNEPLRRQTQSTDILIVDFSLWLYFLAFLWQITMLKKGLSDLTRKMFGQGSFSDSVKGVPLNKIFLVSVLPFANYSSFMRRHKVGQLDSNVKWIKILKDW